MERIMYPVTVTVVVGSPCMPVVPIPVMSATMWTIVVWVMAVSAGMPVVSFTEITFVVEMRFCCVKMTIRMSCCVAGVVMRSRSMAYMGGNMVMVCKRRC